MYVLLVATLLPTVSPLGILAYYNLNKDYIARVLCENRDKPQLHCDGKCYLARRLNENLAREQKAMAHQLAAVSPIQLFCQEWYLFTFPVNLFRSVSGRWAAPTLSYYIAFLSAMRKPPQQD